MPRQKASSTGLPCVLRILLAYYLSIGGSDSISTQCPCGYDDLALTMTIFCDPVELVTDML